MISKRSLAVLVGVLGALALVLVLVTRDDEAEQARERAKAARSVEPTRPERTSRARANAPRRAPPSARIPSGTAPRGDTQPVAASTDSVARTPSPPRPADRAAELDALVLEKAVRSSWVTLDEQDTPCPSDRIRVVYSAPDLAAYRKGAYFEPLGPAPHANSEEVNGLLLCDGSSFLYRGFEAYWRADRGEWDVYPFPVVE